MLRKHDKKYSRIILGVSFILVSCMFQGCVYQEAEIVDPIDGSTFMSYDGAVFPLTSMNDTEGIKVVRELEFDFSPYDSASDEVSRGSIIHDRYTLTNTASQDKTLTLIYPYASSLLDADLPVLTVNDTQITPTLQMGMYSHSNSDMKLDEITYWKDYKNWLADDSYMQDAFDSYPKLNEPVTVYELTNVTDGGSDATAPTLSFEFTIDYNKTKVLSYGFNGGSVDSESGLNKRNFFIPDKDHFDNNEAYILVVIGDDITYRLQGYQNGGCKPGEEIEGADADVIRYETTLGEVLKRIADDSYADFMSGNQNADIITEELFYGELSRTYSQYGDAVFERYIGMLEDIIGDVLASDRILYEAFEVTIPAGESIGVEAVFMKEGSFDFGGTGSKNQGVRGYDTLTQLGSSFTFESQCASFSNLEDIEIVRDNFGIDVNKNVTQVDLDIDKEHYYIEVRTAK